MGIMPTEDKVRTLIGAVALARAAAIHQVRDLAPQQAAFQPSADEWSIVQIIEHLVLAEVSGVSKIWQAAEAARSHPPSAAEGNVNENLSIEEIVTRTWKPDEIAPPIATPHIGGPLAYWIVYFETCQPILEALHPVLSGLDLDTVIFPHFLCGPLNARQRLEFLRFHIERHIGQIARVKSAPGYPA